MNIINIEIINIADIINLISKAPMILNKSFIWKFTIIGATELPILIFCTAAEQLSTSDAYNAQSK